MITHWRNADKSLPKEGKEVLCWVEEVGADGRHCCYGVVLYRYAEGWLNAGTRQDMPNAFVKKWYAFTRPQAKKLTK